MNRTVKITIFVVATIVAAVIGFVLYQNELTSYALIAAAVQEMKKQSIIVH